MKVKRQRVIDSSAAEVLTEKKANQPSAEKVFI